MAPSPIASPASHASLPEADACVESRWWASPFRSSIRTRPPASDTSAADATTDATDDADLDSATDAGDSSTDAADASDSSDAADGG